LLEGVPEGIKLADVQAAILSVAGVASVHDLHVWAITSGKPSLTVHVVSNENLASWPALLGRIRDALEEKFDIHHSTIQIENTPCAQAEEAHSFGEDARSETQHH
jgi:cobalt-zinc-cadmium efflux system protein